MSRSQEVTVCNHAQGHLDVLWKFAHGWCLRLRLPALRSTFQRASGALLIVASSRFTHCSGGGERFWACGTLTCFLVPLATLHGLHLPWRVRQRSGSALNASTRHHGPELYCLGAG